MASLRELQVKITGDSSNFERAIANAQRSAIGLADKMSVASAALNRALTIPLGLAAAAALKSAATFDSLERGLKAVTRETGPLSVQLERLKRVAELPGLGFREAVQGSINLQAAGFSAQTAERALKTFGNALATVGKGRAELDGVITALSQIQSKGKVSAEEINQLAERLPQIRVAMQAAFGTADTELISRSGIGTERFIEAIIKQFEKLPQVTGGLANSFENLRDKAELALGRLGKAISPFAISAIDSITPLIGKLGDLGTAFETLSPTAQNLTLALLALGPAAAVALKVGQLAKELQVVALAGVAAANVSVAFQGMVAAVRAAPAAFAAFTESPAVGLFLGRSSVITAGAVAIYEAFRKLGFLKDSGIDSSTRSLQQLGERFQAVKLASNEAGFGFNTFSDAVFQVGKVARPALTEVDEQINITGASTEKLYTKTKAIPWAEKSKEAALWTAQLNAVQQAQGNLIEQIVRLRQVAADLPLFNFLEPAPKAAELSVGLQEVREEMERIQGENLRAAISFIRVGESVDSLNESIRRGKLFELSQDELNRALGDIQKQNLEIEFPSIGRQQLSQFDRELRGIASGSLRSVADGLADVVAAGEGFGDTMRRVAQSISRNLLSFAIENGIRLVIGELGKLSGVIGSVGRLFGQVFGGVSSAAGAAGSVIQGTASSASQVAGSIGSAGGGVALGGITGAIGAISGIATSIFAGLQYFQGRRMEQDIGRLEVTSRQVFAEISNIRKDAWDQFNQTFTRAGEMLAVLTELRDTRGALAGGGSIQVGTIIVQGGGAREQAENFMREADRLFKLRGGRP